MYALVQDGQVVSTRLPRTGTLPDGRTVSGFDRLPDDVLRDAGWLPLDDPGRPDHDPETQTVTSTYEVLKTKVKVVYKVTDREVVEEDEQEDDVQADLTSRIQAVYDDAPEGPAKRLAAALLGKDEGAKSQAAARPRAEE